MPPSQQFVLVAYYLVAKFAVTTLAHGQSHLQSFDRKTCLCVGSTVKNRWTIGIRTLSAGCQSGNKQEEGQG